MQTIETLKRRIEGAEDLQSVVKTMKTLATVSIRQYERAAESLADYNRTIEMGLQVVLREKEAVAAIAAKHEQDDPRFDRRLGAIIFGSEQGMSGQFNDQIVSFAIEKMDDLHIKQENRIVLALGDRVIARIEDEGQPVAECVLFPGSLTGIASMLREILVIIEEWRLQREIEQIVLFYHEPLSGASYQPRMLYLLPIDPEWFQELREKKWPSRVLPTFTMDWDQLFSALIQQYFFVSLYRSLVQSLASENASRVSAMQTAEKNIEEQLEALYSQFHHQRQSSITAELLDIVAGFEALSGGEMR